MRTSIDFRKMQLMQSVLAFIQDLTGVMSYNLTNNNKKKSA